MKDDYSHRLNLVLDFLIRQRKITPDAAEFLSNLLTNSERRREEQDSILISMDMSYLRDDMDFEQNYESRRNLGCAELALHPRRYSKAAKNLVQSGILVETKDGVAPTEPSHQVPLEILLRQTGLERITNHVPWFTHLIGRLATIAGIIVPLPTRQKLVSEITTKLDQSSSILLSKSPSIFNPAEFEFNYSNHTRYFAEAVGSANQKVYYFWDRYGISSQIQDHLRNSSNSLDELKQKYVVHFAQFAKNPNLTVICGNNSVVQENWDVCPFVSDQFLVKAERARGKLRGGAMVNRQRLEKYATAAPSVGKWVKLSIETYFEDRHERLRRRIFEDPNNILLQRHDDAGVIDFVDEVFAAALSPQYREAQ